MKITLTTVIETDELGSPMVTTKIKVKDNSEGETAQISWKTNASIYQQRSIREDLDPRHDEAVRLLLSAAYSPKMLRTVPSSKPNSRPTSMKVATKHFLALLEAHPHHATLVQPRDELDPCPLAAEAAEALPLLHDCRHPAAEGHVLELSDVEPWPWARSGGSSTRAVENRRRYRQVR